MLVFDVKIQFELLFVENRTNNIRSPMKVDRHLLALLQPNHALELALIIQDNFDFDPLLLCRYFYIDWWFLHSVCYAERSIAQKIISNYLFIRVRET